MDRDKDAKLTYEEFVEGSKQDPTIVQASSASPHVDPISFLSTGIITVRRSRVDFEELESLIYWGCLSTVRLTMHTTFLTDNPARLCTCYLGIHYYFPRGFGNNCLRKRYLVHYLCVTSISAMPNVAVSLQPEIPCVFIPVTYSIHSSKPPGL